MRRMLALLSCCAVLLLSYYLLVNGWPIPTRAGPMFYEWRLGERGWAYWSPIAWNDGAGNTVILDVCRNLVVVGPSAGIRDWQSSPATAAFFSSTQSPILIHDCHDRLFVFGGYPIGVLERGISFGSAQRLRAALGRLDGEEVDLRIRRELPEFGELVRALTSSRRASDSAASYE